MQVTLANWRTAPFNRWAFHHLRELVPSADIPHDPARLRALPPAQAALAIENFENFVGETDTDGLAVLHRGRLVFERYAHGMTDETPHILMSVSKSLLGLLAYDLRLDDERRVTDFLPELERTAYRGATLRQLVDMRAGIVWDEDYLARSGPIVEYRKASGWNPLEPGEAPTDLRSFYQMLKRAEAHGGPVHYVSPNSDLLALIIERATGRRYADLMSERVWKKAGAERSGYITLDRLGAPRAAGGVCATLRDLARIGQWLLEERAGFLVGLERGDPQAWTAGDMAKYYPGLPLRYRNQWYLLDTQPPLAFAMGIHGQNLFIDRASEIVIAKFSSHALPLDAARMALTMRVVAELRKQLA
jgi:CubicO group peptidase (beta-lactamase class C family)